METISDISFKLTTNEIKEAIMEYIDKRIPEKLYMSGTKVDIKLRDVGVDDNDRGPYIPQFEVASATVKPQFRA